ARKYVTDSDFKTGENIFAVECCVQIEGMVQQPAIGRQAINFDYFRFRIYYPHALRTAVQITFYFFGHLAFAVSWRKNLNGEIRRDGEFVGQLWLALLGNKRYIWD